MMELYGWRKADREGGKRRWGSKLESLDWMMSLIVICCVVECPSAHLKCTRLLRATHVEVLVVQRVVMRVDCQCAAVLRVSMEE